MKNHEVYESQWREGFLHAAHGLARNPGLDPDVMVELLFVLTEFNPSAKYVGELNFWEAKQIERTRRCPVALG